jgi:single-stranded-DNA-specific exonuclease
MKLWKLSEPAPEEAYAALPNLPRLLAAIMWRRGIRTPDEAERFLHPSWERDVHDPFLFGDMKKAVTRLIAAKDVGEKIVIHGDYDADGVSGSVILHSALKRLGADVSVYLPHREKEGYGLSDATIGKLADQGAKVIVTCDCGISNAAEIALANTRGIDVIIADHHTLPPELPAAHAILHPLRMGETYPFKHLTGGGVAFKLAQALWKEAKVEEGQDKWLLDMVSISTVADFGKLEGENRALVHFGLKVLNKTRRPGLAALVGTSRLAGREVDSGGIGFQIAPRINAAGRMDHARGAFELLTAADQTTAAPLAEALHQRNIERRSATDKLITLALVMAKEQSGDAAMVIAGEGWPAALCGLVASRLVDEYYRPAIVLGYDAAGKYVGSGRSIPEYNVTEGVRTASATVLKFGGHPAACGLTIEGAENFEAFKSAFKSHATQALAGLTLTPALSIEEEIAVGEANLETVELLSRLEPHGEGNPKPLFLLKGAMPLQVAVVGDGGKHLRVTTGDADGRRLKMIGFNFGPRLREALTGPIDAVIELSVNEWNGRREAQGRIIDFRAI